MGSQQLFCLRWSNHHVNMLNVFDALLQNEALVDVTLACEGLTLKAHKVVLSACSPYFQSLFMDNPCKHPIVILKDIRFADLRALVDFMYKGEVNVTQEQLSALLKTAETLKVKGLAEMTGGSGHVAPTSGAPVNSLPPMVPMGVMNAMTTVPPLRCSPQPIPPHPALQQLAHSLSPPSKRRRPAMRQGRPSSEHPAATSDLDESSLDIQGSPEVIEAKVEVPSDDLAPERPTDQENHPDFHDDRVSNATVSNDGHAVENSLPAILNVKSEKGLTNSSCASPPPHQTRSPSSPPPSSTLPAPPSQLTSASSSSLPAPLPSTSGMQSSSQVQHDGKREEDDNDDDNPKVASPPPTTSAQQCLRGFSLLQAIHSGAFRRFAAPPLMPLALPPPSPWLSDAIGQPTPVLPTAAGSPGSSSCSSGGGGGGGGSSVSGTPKRGQPRILNEDEEAMIVHYILDMAARGKPVARKCVLEYGNMLLRRPDRHPTGSIHCNPEKGLSNDWWKEFRKRHPGLPFRLPVPPSS